MDAKHVLTVYVNDEEAGTLEPKEEACCDRCHRRLTRPCPGHDVTPVVFYVVISKAPGEEQVELLRGCPECALEKARVLSPACARCLVAVADETGESARMLEVVKFVMGEHYARLAPDERVISGLALMAELFGQTLPEFIGAHFGPEFCAKLD